MSFGNSKISSIFSTRVFWLLGILGGMRCYVAITRYKGIISDFTQDYSAAFALRYGFPIYGESITKIGLQVFGSPDNENYHPPWNAVFFLPLTGFSHVIAFVLWGIFSVFLYLAVLEVVFLVVGVQGKLRMALRLLLLLWGPFTNCLGTGQSSIVIVFLLTVGWFIGQRGYSYLSGALLGLSVCFKLYPGLIVIYLFFRRDFRALASFAGVVTAMTLVTVAAVGSEDFLHYFTTVMKLDVERFGGVPFNHSVTGFFTKVFDETPWSIPLSVSPLWRTICIFATSLVLFVLYCYRVHTLTLAGDHTGSVWAFSLTCITMLLLSPLSWSHAFPLVLLPTAWLFHHLFRNKQTKALWLLGLAFALISLPDVEVGRNLLEISADYKIQGIPLLLMTLPCLGLFCMWVMLYRYSMRTLQTR